MSWRSPMQSALADKELQAQAAGLKGPSLCLPAVLLLLMSWQRREGGRQREEGNGFTARWTRAGFGEGVGGLYEWDKEPLESSGNSSLAGFWPAVKLGVNSRCWRGLLLSCHRDSGRRVQTKRSALPPRAFAVPAYLHGFQGLPFLAVC